METIHVQFDELTASMALVYLSTGPAPMFLTLGQISSGIVPNPVSATPYVPPTNKDLEILIQPMFDVYLKPLRVKRPVSPAQAVQAPVNSVGVAAESTFMEDNVVSPVDNNSFINVFALEPSSGTSSSRDVSSTESTCVSQTIHHLIEPKNFKSTITEDCWFQAMQDEIHEFDQLQVWELVPQPDCIMIITLKWIYKVKLDEYDDVLKNKARLVAKGYRQEEGIDFEESFAPVTPYADADHAGCQDKRRSTSESAQFLGDKLVSWSSKKQKSTAISTTKAEYIAIAIALYCNNVKHSRSKHIDLRHHFIREQVEKGVVELYFVTTDYQLTNIFTKVLPRQRFKFILSRLAPTMAPPTRTDDQILPHIRWVPIGKSNCYLDVKKSQSNPIYKIMVDILKEDLGRIHPSIHTFIEDKKNLAHHTYEKKKATLIVILSIWFTKLIIYHLQSKHKFHPRPDSPLHLPNEELILGYLKFSAKRTKREVFGMPIPGNLITTDIQDESCNQEYLAKPTKTTKKSKPTVPKAYPRPPVSKPASSQQHEPKPAPAKTQGKKRIPKKEPRVDDEETDVQRALEESLKKVQGKGKDKVTEEQVTRDLLTLQMPKKKSPADQYISQRCTSIHIGSSGHDESSSLYAELGLMDSEVESDEDVPRIDAGVQGQAGPNPGDAAASQPLPSPVVHAGLNLEHMDFEVADVSTQHHPEQIDEGFTTTTYLKVQENLKLTVEEHVILEEPASLTETLSSLQHLMKDLSFGELFFNDKPSEADNEKTTAETEAESMVSVTIQLDKFVIPPMTTPVVDLTSRPESPNVHRPLQAMATETTTTTTTTTIHPPPSQPQQSTIDYVTFLIFTYCLTC
nr:retrovirus-related Pol polyprotein from transposon TNT 1-94 [Tanacetum cinerariifolium]